MVSGMSSEEKEGTNDEEVSEEKEVEEALEEELPKLSIQDIELLMKNTEIWDSLLNGKISIEEAKKLFEDNYKEYEKRDSRRKTKRAVSKKVKKTKKKEKSVEG
ncbi:RNA polymerase Rpo13 [Sulfolobus sp. E5-1-F]|uniref:RNA polymerase subunit Rpo13 n=1 Tax=Saccharolobus sp. E5-1-F TaxID=2663019 RepID=UPI001296E932|nr:RNA polymerase subunit Rpo13 [Sulfolobus sp. E5-1-F]QGA54811.1 RNA polymerase Rpo13 [Sulfolobus sp. E5-1-F]